MNTVYTTYSLNIPTSDVTLLKSLAKKFGWTTKRERGLTKRRDSTRRYKQQNRRSCLKQTILTN